MLLHPKFVRAVLSGDRVNVTNAQIYLHQQGERYLKSLDSQCWLALELVDALAEPEESVDHQAAVALMAALAPDDQEGGDSE